MFELIVMPLVELWAEDVRDVQALQDAIRELQETLSGHVGHEISWEEELSDDASFEADGLDAYCVFALRAVAAWLEFNDTLEGFELDEYPWLHPVFQQLEERGHAEKFVQFLHSSDSDCTAFVPAEMPDVFLLEDASGTELPFLIGSLQRLRAELDELRGALELEPNLEEHLDDLVFDPEEDPLAAPRYGWVVLSARTNEALSRNLPLVLLVEPGDEDEEEETEGDSEDEGSVA